jgi:acetyl-CoA acetyltransferase
VSATNGLQVRDETAIVGVGNTNFGAMYRNLDPERTAHELAADALKAAIEDAGIDKNDIDGLISVRVTDYGRMADVVGLPHLRLVNGLEGSGRMAGVALQYAVMAIVTGQADTVAIVYGNNGRSVGERYGGRFSGDSPAAWDAMYGMTSPGAAVSHMWRRYMHLYGASEEALAAAAINNRKNAAKNPVAVMQKPITLEEYMAARYIAEPLRLFDYCLINDGGVAMIVTSAERAKTLKQPPVYVGATYSATDLTNYYTTHDFFYGAIKDIADRLYKAADVTPSEVDLAQLYDNFTPTQFFALEGLGFCEQGTAWQWAQGGRIELDGELPVNTSGGHTGESYMQGHGLTIELVRQLRGQGGERQVANATVGLYCCPAPICNAHILHN